MLKLFIDMLLIVWFVCWFDIVKCVLIFGSRLLRNVFCIFFLWLMY